MSSFLNRPHGFIIGGSFKKAGYHNRDTDIQTWAVCRGMVAVTGVVLRTALSQPGREQQDMLRLCGKQSFRILQESSFTKKVEASEGQHSGGT